MRICVQRKHFLTEKNTSKNFRKYLHFLKKLLLLWAVLVTVSNTCILSYVKNNHSEIASLFILYFPTDNV